MSWKSILKEHGYDHTVVKDAKGPLEVGVIERQDLNGAVIGNPCECCGSKLIRRSLSAKLAWVGAEFAVVVYNEKKILRYRHNGGIPSMQDRGFFPIGQPLRLRPPGKWEKLGNGGHGLVGGHRKKAFQHRFSSIVGQFRR